MTAAARRMIGLVLVCACLLCGALWWALDGRAASQGEPAELERAAPRLAVAPAAPPVAAAPAGPRPAPAPGRPVDPRGAMPPALARELRTFDDARIRSELQAIARGFPS